MKTQTMVLLVGRAFPATDGGEPNVTALGVEEQPCKHVLNKKVRV